MKGLDPDLRALQEVRDAVARAQAAVKAVHDYDQARVDRMCEFVARAGADAAHDLARLAVDETGIGRVHYKVLKNLLGSEGVWESIRAEKTVGIVRRDDRAGVLEVATPVGVIAGIIPTTNPTSTALYKSLISIKGRNAVVISPHPRAKRCIFETAEVVRRAIERAGGPPDLVQCLTNPTIESTGALMKHKGVALILSTGGGGLVRAAYSSGKPAYGVGPGNVPCYVDRSANVSAVAEFVVGSQSFDNATLCCSEQALVVDRPVETRLIDALVARGAHLCSEEETQKLGAFCNVDGHMNPAVVGLDPWRVAEMAGFRVPRETSLLLAYQDGVGKKWPLSIEILCPLLSVHVVDGWEQGCATSMELLHLGGLGHTLGVHAEDEAVLEAFFLQKPASRIIANGPTSQGATGFSTNLIPAMSLGCGPQAGNITSDNITAKHLVNLKRVAFPRSGWRELERTMHERAAAMTGVPAPRGSGLPGDPALEIAAVREARDDTPSPVPARPETAASNWAGNPTFVPQPEPPRRPSPPTSAVSGSTGSAPASPSRAPLRPSVAPTFTRPASAPTVAPSRPSAAAAPAPVKRGGHVAGDGLSPAEIENILAHAGEGCPLGPCKGCPHLDVQSGACTA